MRLAVGCITRDESDSLPGMIESIRGIADEIHVCDTGSTDNTVELAKQMDVNIYIHPRADEWREKPELFRFDEARNYLLDQFDTEASHPDWILSIDCDERLDEKSAAVLRAHLDKLPDSVELALLTMVMCMDDGVQFQRFLAERLLRGGRNVRFANGMHNIVSVPTIDESGGASVKRVEMGHIEILHNRTHKNPQTRGERAQQRVAMAKSIFPERIQNNEDDTRSRFYLAGTLYDNQEIDQAVPMFEDYLLRSEWPHERYQAAVLLARCYLKQGRRDDARRAISMHLIDNWRRAEGLMMLGEMAYEDGDYEQAEWWFKLASMLPIPVDPMFVEVEAHTWQPHTQLWLVYVQTGQIDKARRHGQLAIEAGSPHTGEIIKWEKNIVDYKCDKILCLVDRGQMNFIDPVIADWRAQGKEVDVITKPEDVTPERMADCDVVWCEWAGDLAAVVTNLETDLPKPRIVVRIHGYETHVGKLQQVQWANVDDVIFVAEYLKQLAMEQCPQIERACNVYVVPGGIETGKFELRKPKDGKKIAMACFGNHKKNFPLALQVLAKLPVEYTLHIATEWQDHRLDMYIQHIIDELGLRERVIFYPWQSDLNEFYADKSVYLSSSIEESFHYSLAEAMAAGLKPVIHAWKSASDFYPDGYIFRTVDEASDMIRGRHRPQEYRDYAVKNLDVSCNLRRIGRIMGRPHIAVCGRPSHEGAVEYKLVRALETLGVKTDGDNPDVVIITGHNPTVEPWMDGKKKVLWQEDIWTGISDKAARTHDAITQVVPQVDLVISEHPGWLDEFKRCGAKKVRYLPVLGACGPFRKLCDIEKEYDVVFWGHATERREPIIQKLGERFNVLYIKNEYDHEKVNYLLNKAKIGVNLHAYDDPIIEWRIAEMMSAGLPVVTEKLPADHPYDSKHLIEVKIEKVGDAIAELLVNDARRETLATEGYKWIWKNYRLDQQAEKLVEIIEEELR